jgi:HSP20 family protein
VRSAAWIVEVANARERRFTMSRTLMRREARYPELPSLLTRMLLPWPDWFGEELQAEQIPLEEFEEDGTLVIRAELPGIDPERDVEITVQDGILRIRAERRREEKAEEPHFYREEIRYGAFSRSITLPPESSPEDVTAQYADGILTVRLPLSTEKTAATKVPITQG